MATSTSTSTNVNTDNWPNWLFTLGHYAKGTIYSIAGGLALATVLGAAGGPSGPKKVLQFVNQQPFGQVLLAILAVGLLCYCGWRWYKAIADPTDEGTDSKAIVKRIAWASSGSFYGLLAVYAFSIVFGSSGGSSGGGTKSSVVGSILSQPFGQVLVGILAAIFLGTAIYQLMRGIKEKYMEDIDESKIGQDKAEVYRKMGKAGHIARAVIFTIIAYFLFRTAMASNASRVRGMEGALEYLQNNTYGVWLLGIVGAGMVFYGVFMFVKARYHQLSQ